MDVKQIDDCDTLGVSDTSHRTGDRGGEFLEKGSKATHAIGRTIEEHPTATLLIAAAVGFGISWLAHRHRAPRQLSL
jgi:ElaB/YqjD/DUF883 family membrane-anchored ribosome-binding protein